MDRKLRFPFPPSFSITPWLLLFALSLVGLSACEQQSPWPRVGEAMPNKDGPCQGTPGAVLPGKPAQPEAATSSSGGPSSEVGSAPDSSAQNMDLTNSQDSSSTTESSEMTLSLWELLYDPDKTDGLAQSPEFVDFLIAGRPGAEGAVLFELRGQGWSRLTQDDFASQLPPTLPTGAILRIERYKNQAELDKANKLFPVRQVLDPSSGRLAVQILRHTGAGLRNKGGWLLLRSGEQQELSGVAYGDIEAEKIDPALLEQWRGPWANPAPAGQALCQIPKKEQDTQSHAAWWTACQASSWGRPQGEG